MMLDIGKARQSGGRPVYEALAREGLMMRKALGRCMNRHAQVVEYEGDEPTGVCSRCGEKLIEWAVKTPPTKESGR